MNKAIKLLFKPFIWLGKTYCDFVDKYCQWL